MEHKGYFTSQPQLHLSGPPFFIGLYRHIADPALHGHKIAPLHPRPPDLCRKSQLGSRNLHTDTITGLENHTLDSFFHGNQTRVHCPGKTSANCLSQFLPS
eukprot:15327033-Ditylum_brightwellii.AAC.1